MAWVVSPLGYKIVQPLHRVQQCYGDYETGGVGLGLEYTLTLKLELDSAFRR